MENNIKETLEGLVAVHGPEKVLTLAQDILRPLQGQPGPNTLTVEAGETFAYVLDNLMKLEGKINETVVVNYKAMEKTLEAATAVKPPQVVPTNHNNIQPHNLDYVNDQLEAASQALNTANVRLCQAMEGRAELYKAIARLETQVKLDESEAIMGWEYEGGKPVAHINGQKVPMGNDTVRDAFRRTASKDARLALAEKQAEAKGFEMNIAQAKQDYDAAVELLSGIKAKAANQAALLNFLARG